MKTMRQWLQSAEKLAVSSNKEDSAIKLLMQHATGKESYEILAELDQEMPEDFANVFEEAVTKYIDDNVPIQHIMGYETFYGYKFKVNEDVLIPRFETEELVSKVLELYDEHFDGSVVDVVDVGTGSGAIGLTLKLEAPAMNMTVTDISPSALTVAKENANNLHTKAEFIQSDMLDELIEAGKTFDILVSNPPYIPIKEEVESLVLDNEPHLALFGGDDGLYFYRRILKDAHKILKPKNIIAFEHAYHHREGMATLISEYFPNSKFETIKDMQGKDRMTVILNV